LATLSRCVSVLKFSMSARQADTLWYKIGWALESRSHRDVIS
jgi:hypothetical protein